VDIGPGAGDHGGHIVASGTPKQIMRNKKSLTGAYLNGTKFIPIPAERRKKGKHIEIVGATENNLKNISAKFPIGLFTVVTGVSGSGKSKLVNEILYRSLANHLYKLKQLIGGRENIKVLKHIEILINVHRAPISRTT